MEVPRSIGRHSHQTLRGSSIQEEPDPMAQELRPQALRHLLKLKGFTALAAHDEKMPQTGMI